MSALPDPLEVQEGEEFTLDLPARWGRLQPVRGEVVEVHLASTNHASASPLWAGFLIMETIQDSMGAFASRGKFLGVNDSALSKEFSNKFNRRTSWLHFCRARPCFEFEEEYALHVTRARWWTLGAFETEYMTSQVRRQARKWAGIDKEKDLGVPAEIPRPLGALPKSGARPLDAPNDNEYEPSLLEEVRPPGLELPEPGEEEKLPDATGDEKRRALKERLHHVREKLAPGAGQPLLPPGPPIPPAGIGDVPMPGLSERLQRTQKMHTGSGLPSGLMPLQAVPPAGTKGGTMKLGRGPGRDLVVQAMNTMSQKEKLKRKKKKKKDKGRRVAEAFRDMFRGKKKKKKKKKQGAGGPGQPPSSSSSSASTRSTRKGPKKNKKRKVMTQADGTILSYSASSSSDSDDQESSTSTDLEAPLKKKSQRHPGSILALLVNHVKMQLNQGSVLDLDPSTDSVTQGVKVTTYFSLHVRSQFPQAMREMRELYSLARIIDTLRTGDVGVASDQLAARFIALHQSLLDGGWATARHMELCPLEESNAATPSMVLASRRHSKLYQKMQGFEGSGSYGQGRGRGGRQWSSWGAETTRGEGNGKGKGKNPKGKGKYSDSKGKAKGTQGTNNPWGQNLDKGEDKGPAK